jgi:hypothetical protein
MWSGASVIFISSLQRLLTANFTLIPQRHAVAKVSQDNRFSEAMALQKDMWTLPTKEGARFSLRHWQRVADGGQSPSFD